MSGLLIPRRDEGGSGEELTSDRHPDGVRPMRELRGELGELLCAYRDPENSPRGGAILWMMGALLLWSLVILVGMVF